MYELRDDIRHIGAERDQVVAIIESINTPMVAAANKPLEPANAFIVGVRNPSGRFSIYIYLHLLQSVECLIFLHTPPEISMEQYHAVEMEALQFVESMGFMLDNANFRKLSEENQITLMKNLPVFHPDLQAFARNQKAVLGTTAAGDEQILELDDLAETNKAPPAPDTTISREGLAKIVRMLSSF